VVSAQFMLDSESQLQEVIRKMMGVDNPDAAGEEDLEDLF